MRTIEEIESFLYELEVPFERLDDDGMWRVTDEWDNVENIVVYKAGAVLNFRLKLFDLPENTTIELLRRLLELNSAEMVHGAFGIEGDAVTLTAALEVENLDRNEVQATLDSFGLAIRSHHEELSKLLDAAA